MALTLIAERNVREVRSGKYDLCDLIEPISLPDNWQLRVSPGVEKETGILRWMLKGNETYPDMIYVHQAGDLVRTLNVDELGRRSAYSGRMKRIRSLQVYEGGWVNATVIIEDVFVSTEVKFNYKSGEVLKQEALPQDKR